MNASKSFQDREKGLEDEYIRKRELEKFAAQARAKAAAEAHSGGSQGQGQGQAKEQTGGAMMK